MEKNIINALLKGYNYPLDVNVSVDSSDHVRFQNGQNVSEHNYYSHRRLVIEKNVGGEERYTVTMYNNYGKNSLWKNPEPFGFTACPSKNLYVAQVILKCVQYSSPKRVC